VATAKLSAQLGDNAEGAGMIAALVDLDVGSVARRREQAGREIVVEIGGRRAGGGETSSDVDAASLGREASSPRQAARMLSISLVPTTASTSGICARIWSR